MDDCFSSLTCVYLQTLSKDNNYLRCRGFKGRINAGVFNDLYDCFDKSGINIYVDFLLLLLKYLIPHFNVAMTI